MRGEQDRQLGAEGEPDDGDATARVVEELRQGFGVLEIPLGQYWDHAIERSTEVEQAIASDTLLTRDKQDAMLAMYGYLTGRDSVRKVALWRFQPKQKVELGECEALKIVSQQGGDRFPQGLWPEIGRRPDYH